MNYEYSYHGIFGEFEAYEAIRREREEGRNSNAEIAEKLGSYRQADFSGWRDNNKIQEQYLKEYAKEKDIWFSKVDIVKNSAVDADGKVRKFKTGAEAEVYLNKDLKTVTKIVNYSKHNKTPLDFIDNRILLFNFLFPGTSYTITSFTLTEYGFSFVVEQPLIEGKLLEELTSFIEKDSSQFGRIREFMKDRFDMDSISLFDYSKGDVTVGDLHLRNVIEGIDGNLYVIDANTSVKPH